MNRIYLILLFILVSCTSSDSKRFRLIPEEETGISFENKLTYTEEFNPYTYRNFYNGAGVAIGDINNDGLLDIYLTGNIEDNKLYLNRGNWNFEDITLSAGVACHNIWSTGATFVDINADGFLDLYVCKSGKPGGENRANELFINQGDNTFIEQAKAYGLDVKGLSVHAAFLDYDKDGDLDAYVLNNSIRSVGGYDLIEGQRSIPDPNNNGNKFFENQNGTFVDVTTQVGMYTSAIGFGLGITVSDFNNDEWPDLFISNDFFEKDYLYLNTQEGSFEEVSDAYFGSLSMGSMGADAADLDNDLSPDLLVTEMLPKTLKRKKTKAKYDSWDKFTLMQKKGYANQLPRNVLQRNIEGKGFFEVGRKSGVAATEWSWASLLFDMDNDGLRDIFIANGINKDLLDRDYLAYMANEEKVRTLIQQKEEVIKKLIDIMPSQAVSNVSYRNLGEFDFEEVTEHWGLDQPSFSNGNAYGDLDNDGDLDLIVNNVNMPVFVYQNQTDTLSQRGLQVEFSAQGQNTKLIGTKAIAYTGNNKQIAELYPSRGFQSSVPHRLHFGVGVSTVVDSLLVTWPTGEKERFTQLKTNQIHRLSPTASGVNKQQPKAQKSLSVVEAPFSFVHQENNFIEFNRERLTTQMHSNDGPALATADVNQDGKTDVFIGGAKGQSGKLFISQKNGSFQEIVAPFEADLAAEDTQAMWMDIDQDQDLDLIVASGGKAFSIYSSSLTDRVYENKGNNVWERKKEALSFDRYFPSKALAKADFNQDGKMDLFIGERYNISTYGFPGDGFLMLNKGNGIFEQVQKPVFEAIGMMTDAVFSDLNGDGWEDLIVVGEWMPIRVFINQKGTFVEKTKDLGLTASSGLWNTLEVADVNQDGYIDILAGNHGTNTFLEANMKMFVADFDANGSAEQILCVQRNNAYYPLADKDELIAQMPVLKKKIVYYNDYANKKVDEILPSGLLENAYQVELNRLETTLYLGGKDGFLPLALPPEIQYAPVYAIQYLIDEKSNEKSLYLGGNQYLVKPQFGRYDASKGWKLSLHNEAATNLVFGKPKSLTIDGQIRGIAPLKLNNKTTMLFVINDEEIQFYPID